MSAGADAIYERVNQRILEALDRGVVPWRQPWTSRDPFQHRNAATNHAYRGVNVFLLTLTQLGRGYATPRWLTFRQAQALGGSVRAGERGTPVIFWQLLERTRHNEDGQEETVKIPVLRYYTVFNVDQTSGLNASRLVPVQAPRPATFSPREEAERVVAGYVGAPPILHRGARAFWNPATDQVVLPRPQDFDSTEAYYGTLFHELVHSTGHGTRLDRDGIREGAHFGSALYGREELVAEMGAAFLQARAGIEGRLDASASYVENWMRAIQADRKLLVVASAQAQRASEWILGTRERGPAATLVPAGEAAEAPA